MSSPSTETKNTSGNVDESGNHLLPLNRIRTIMKSTADETYMKIVSQETLHAVCRATELFIQSMATESLNLCPKDGKAVEYKQLADYVQSQEKLEFLHQILPKKITVKEFRKIMDNLPDPDDSSADSSSSSSSSSTGSGSDDDEEEEVDEEGGEQAAVEEVKKTDTKKETTAKSKSTETVKGGKMAASSTKSIVKKKEDVIEIDSD